jgi:hypothetical protein
MPQRGGKGLRLDPGRRCSLGRLRIPGWDGGEPLPPPEGFWILGCARHGVRTRRDVEVPQCRSLADVLARRFQQQFAGLTSSIMRAGWPAVS